MVKRDRRHYVPAALIGYFANAPNLANLRRSKVAVHRFAPPVNFESAAENVGFSRTLYRGTIPLIGNAHSADHDNYFFGLEVHALRPVDRLLESASNDLPADEWAKLAAFITSQFTRDPSLEAELDEQAEQMGIPRDKLDIGYPLNTQRVASAVLRARWEFLRAPKDLILNDRAVSAAQFGDWNLWGYFIPLRKDFGVRIAGGPYPKQITWNGSEWRINIPMTEMSEERTGNLNRWTWCGAAAELYGSSLELLAEIEGQAMPMRDALPNLSQYITGAGLLGESDKQRRDDEMLLFSLLGGITPPENPNDAPTLVV